MEAYNLTDREKAILRYVVQQFILTASPVGSRNLSKKFDIGLSAASIRNIMADLEEFGLLGHPHTSAGRIPTDKGYRIYVDSLMGPPTLTEKMIQQIESSMEALSHSADSNELLEITSYILSNLTHQLACVTFPRFENAILEKIQIVSLTSTRVMIVITVKSGLVRTITLEVNTKFQSENLNLVQQLLNEKLSGLRFSEIRKTFAERVKDYNRDEIKPVIRLFIDSVDKIFTDTVVSQKAVISGAANVLRQPEFEDHDNLQGVIELIENKDIIIHLMDKKRNEVTNSISISIGRENEDEQFYEYSLITKDYKIGDTAGTVGIIGPKRMEYSKIVAAVVFVAEALSKELKKNL